jgi:hypothetical protein
MTCFWVGVMQGLDISCDIVNFIYSLKRKVRQTKHVSCNGIRLTSNQLLENMRAVKQYAISSANQGYDCSAFDPFLMLICELYSINIVHIYRGIVITYKNESSSNKTVHVESDGGHFWFTRVCFN